MSSEYYLGFDLGTDSVGWAVTDPDYNLKKYRGNLMWGVMLFDEAKHANERRGFRTARRRLNRRKQRIQLLQELLRPEIIKTDEHFFDRLEESKLFPEDMKYRTCNIYFDDKNYTDKDYFRQYPTVHHLICELMNSDEPHDIRLVYLACAYILKHRGHFLIEIDSDSINEVKSFAPLFEKFAAWFESTAEIQLPFECGSKEFGDILKKKISITAKEREFKALLFGGTAQGKDEEYPLNVSKLFKLICGGKVKLSEIFKNEDYKELEQDSVCVASADFDDILEEMYTQLNDGDGELLKAVKAMYDWSLLEDILTGHSSISEAKIAAYKEHQRDLRELKDLISAYLTHEEYAEVFKEAGDKNNYVSYSQNLKSLKKGVYPKIKCSQEEFCKFIDKYLEKISPTPEDKEKYDRIRKKTEEKALCPKQVTGDNRVIPYQLYYAELKTILNNAEKYLPILKQADSYGSVKDKILSIMKFKIPYYVGPLVKFEGANCHAWIERKAEGKIYPWNFDDMVDLDKSEDAFIKHMTRKCAYIAGEDVLPKNSLLYTKFTVLNEINNLSVDSERISFQVKEKIYTKLFVEKSVKVTKKKIRSFLISEGDMNSDQELSGVDEVLKSSLKPYHDFKRFLSNGTLNEMEVEAIIERITVTADRGRLKKWLKDNCPILSDEDIAYISKLSYKEYGRLSRMLLEGIKDIDVNTGEVTDCTIISSLWETQQNLTELLSERYGFSRVIEDLNNEYYGKNKKSPSERLEDMYVPVAARRTIVRALEIAKEIRHIMRNEPKKIFVEMPRGGSTKAKSIGSGKKYIKDHLELAREFTDSAEIDNLERQLEDFNDSSLRSEKYYLYFMQLGRCMYSHEAINLAQIGNNNIYNIDHIIPQAKKIDSGINNKVLVKSGLNGAKKDDYPIAENIRIKMYGFWKSLKESNLITEEKFRRLIRAAPLNDSELTEFINRQTVETAQSSKAAAELLKELFPDSEIVRVKSGLVSELRYEYDMLKCREINDLYHAKDAYLSIVMGNVHDAMFTKNPINLIKKGEAYSMKMKTYLSWNITRGDNAAWVPNVTIATVRKMMSKNSVRYVKYAYKPKGQLYEATINKAAAGLIETKKGLDTEKYGGYNSSALSFFVPVKFGEPSVCLMPVELLYAKRFESDKDFAVEYCAKTLSSILNKSIARDQLSFPLGDRIIKKNALLEINGCRYNLSSKSGGGKTLVIALAESHITDKDKQDYMRKLMKYISKSEKCKKFKVSQYDGISKEKNTEIFDLICEKCANTPFNTFLDKMGKKIAVKREVFKALTIEEQALLLEQLILLLKTGRTGGCDLQLIKESRKAGVITMNSTLNKIKGLESVYLIDQSPTGLFEKRSPNLLKL